MTKILFMEKTEKDFQSSIKILRTLLELYNSGTKEAYRPISVELRKLLCDKNALIPRARPNLKLHILNSTDLFENASNLKDKIMMMMPGRIASDGKGNYSYQLTFARSQTLMSVKEWVSQPMLSKDITIWELIKSVADKEGAHSDRDYDSTLLLAKFMICVDDESHIPSIVAIADYVVKLIDNSKSL